MADENQTPFNDQQLDTIKSLVSGIVNSAISARDKMADKKRAEDRDAILKGLDEKLAALKPVPSDEGEGGKDGKGKKGENVELATLRKQLADTNAKVEAAERRAAESRARERSVALRQTTAEELSKHGIEGNRFKAAFAMLQQDGRIKHRDDDSDDLVFVDDAGTEVELTVGLAAWIKSDDAKIVLPPSGTRGAGTRPGSGSAPGVKLTKEQAQAKGWEAAGEALKGAFGGFSGSM